MDNLPYSLPLLWEKTNNGLQIFQDIFVSQLGTNKGMKGFVVRPDDKTGSCHISKSKKTGLYLFTDFGVESKGINAIDYIIKTENLTFPEACKKLFNQYGLSISEFQKIKPITKFSAKITQENGFWNVDYFDKIQDENSLRKIIPFYTDDLLNHYHFKQIINYENVGIGKTNNLYHRIITATPEFPIYGYDYKDFAKIYQPVALKNDDFLQKHGYVGKKTERFVYGWEQAFERVDLKKIEFLLDAIKDTKTKRKITELQEQITDLQLECVIIATGGSDGLNLASLGYNVIWFNSETEVITKKEYAQLCKIAKQIYYVADLDETGIKQAVKLATTCINVKILWLPNFLLQQNKKDFSDWIRDIKNRPLTEIQNLFSLMLTGAMAFKFWERSDKSIKLSPKKLIHYLTYNDFRTYKEPFLSADSGKEPDGYFVQVKHNTITKVFPSDIRNEVTAWLNTTYQNIDVCDSVLRSPFFNQNSLKSLPSFNYKKTNCGVDFQFYLFENKAIKVTAKEIQFLDFSDKLNLNVWENDKIKHHLTPVAPFFEIYKDEFERQRIKILDNSSNHLKVLINTSRMFWQKDTDETGQDTNNFQINSENLTADENYLQELHLLNKLQCSGYLLHQHKVASNSHLVLGCDFVSGTSIKESKGGTGKTFLQKSLKNMLKMVFKNAKGLKDQSFPMDGITPKTNFVLFDDLDAFQPIEFFYTMITDDTEANQKGGVIYKIPFSHSPKYGATTNFAPEMKGATQRRLNVYFNSDYYHEKTEDSEYLFSRKISDDFNGKDILTDDYSTENWNLDYNFQLQMLQFFLQNPTKIDVPMGTLLAKNAMMRIGDAYTKFFKELFSDDNNLNNWVEKSIIIAQCKEDLGVNFKSPQKFLENLKIFVSAYRDIGWSLELDKQKNNAGNSVPHFCIKTTPLQEINNTVATPEQAQLQLSERPDDLPF